MGTGCSWPVLQVGRRKSGDKEEAKLSLGALALVVKGRGALTNGRFTDEDPHPPAAAAAAGAAHPATLISFSATFRERTTRGRPGSFLASRRAHFDAALPHTLRERRDKENWRGHPAPLRASSAADRCKHGQISSGLVSTALQSDWLRFVSCFHWPPFQVTRNMCSRRASQLVPDKSAGQAFCGKSLDKLFAQYCTLR